MNVYYHICINTHIDIVFGLIVDQFFLMLSNVDIVISHTQFLLKIKSVQTNLCIIDKKICYEQFLV